MADGGGQGGHAQDHSHPTIVPIAWVGKDRDDSHNEEDKANDQEDDVDPALLEQTLSCLAHRVIVAY